MIALVQWLVTVIAHDDRNWDKASTLRLTAKQRMYGPAARLKMISEVANVRSCINVSDLWSGADLAPGH